MVFGALFFCFEGIATVHALFPKYCCGVGFLYFLFVFVCRRYDLQAVFYALAFFEVIFPQIMVSKTDGKQPFRQNGCEQRQHFAPKIAVWRKNCEKLPNVAVSCKKISG